MKTTTLVLFSVLILSGCSEPKPVPKIKPDFFFKWDIGMAEGHCLNKNGLEGYNPRYIGPCGDLRGLKIASSALDGADLRGANLDGMDLSDFSLNGANLFAVKARGTKFSSSRLNGAKLMYAHLQGSRFDGAELNGADFTNAKLSGVSLVDVKLYGAKLHHSDVSGAKLPLHLRTVDLRQARFSYGTLLPFDEEHAQKRGMLPQPITLVVADQEVEPSLERKPSNEMKTSAN